MAADAVRRREARGTAGACPRLPWLLRRRAGSAGGQQLAVDDGDRRAGQQRAVAAQLGADEAGAGGGLEAGQVASRPRRADQNGASAVCALPVTGSSSMPTPGKKQRETKS